MSLPSSELCANTGTLGSEQLENVRGLRKALAQWYNLIHGGTENGI